MCAVTQQYFTIRSVGFQEIKEKTLMGVWLKEEAKGVIDKLGSRAEARVRQFTHSGNGNALKQREFPINLSSFFSNLEKLYCMMKGNPS